jgi:hypothetical protein
VLRRCSRAHDATRPEVTSVQSSRHSAQLGVATLPQCIALIRRGRTARKTCGPQRKYWAYRRRGYGHTAVWPSKRLTTSGQHREALPRHFAVVQAGPSWAAAATHVPRCRRRSLSRRADPRNESQIQRCWRRRVGRGCADARRPRRTDRHQELMTNPGALIALACGSSHQTRRVDSLLRWSPHRMCAPHYGRVSPPRSPRAPPRRRR